MVVSLVRGLEHNTWLLQKVCAHVRSSNMETSVEVDFEIFSKSAAIVVTNGFGITERLTKSEIFKK